MSTLLPTPVAVRSPTSAIRWLRAAAGLGCFALAAVGAVVPGLPTTVFLLLGSYWLTRSCPVLERRLRDSRIFRPYAVYLDPTVPLPRRARVTALAAMWTSIAASGFVLWQGRPSPPALVLLTVAGLVGTAAILRFRTATDAARTLGPGRSGHADIGPRRRPTGLPAEAPGRRPQLDEHGPAIG